MKIQKNVSLKSCNTFGLEVIAAQFTEVSTAGELARLLENPDLKETPKFILGGGSNILFTKDFNGLVIRNRILGMETIRENENFVWVRAGAGVVWHQFVMWCIDHGFAGLENLSLIPGSVGAAPIQNIGAYGVEIKDTFYELEAMHLNTGIVRKFSKDECGFG
ncbi:MAG TPA: FAD-binding protein, partial [Bacteroidia bacterium]|nr:FAD-binding protein [Bacteroidia bacterium]